MSRYVGQGGKSLGIVSVAALLTILGGCGGGGGSSTTTTTTTGGSTQATNSEGEVISAQTTGIAVPSEISAVPASSSSSGASFKAKLQQLSHAARAATAAELPATSDYAKAKPNIYVEERALEQFDIIEQVFGALAQTNYAEDDNVNQGPYVAMVSWEVNEGGKDIKQLQRWTVESRMIKIENMPSDVTGNDSGDVNKLLAWIPERDRSTGEEELVKAEFLIYTAPTTDSEGALLNYGEWDMNVLMAASPDGVDTIPTDGADNYFAASARIGTDGRSTLMVHDKFTEDFGDGMELSDELKGVLIRDGETGFGIVSYPDWDSCYQGMGGGGDGGGEGGDGGPEGGEGGMEGGDMAMGEGGPEGGPGGEGGGMGMMDNPCADGIPTNVAKYAYNANYLGVQQIDDGEEASAVYKDRSLDGAIRIIHEYELFFAEANEAGTIGEGDNLRRHQSYGFPVIFEGSAESDESVTFDEFAFYGAWQGRHQLWGPSGIDATTDGSDGTVLNRADVPPNQTGTEYRLKEFDGTFTLRTLINANIDDIKGIPVETWLNDNYELFYQSSPTAGWYYCPGELDWGNHDFGSSSLPPCKSRGGSTTLDMVQLGGTGDTVSGQLSVGENDRRWVNIDSFDPETGQMTQYVYLTGDAATSGDGFYEAQWGNRGLTATTPKQKLTPSDGSRLNVNLGGSVYVSYVGFGDDVTATTTGWVSKTLSGFDENTWQPTFSTDSGADQPFTPEQGQEYYMHVKGQNYVVTRVSSTSNKATDYVAKLELQTAANPRNTNSAASTPATILPSGTSYLATPWNQTVRLTLEDDPSEDNYLLLVVSQDTSNELTVGDAYEEDSWGLMAYNSSGEPLGLDGDGNTVVLTADEFGWVDPEDNNGLQPVQFNYEYAGGDGNSWGKQQFLVTAGDLTNYIILSDPVSLVNVQLYDNLGNEAEVVSLQYDGWMHGMPDMYRELERNGWEIGPEIGDKVRRLMPGQMVTDSFGTDYFVKPMQVSLFLGVIGEETIPDGSVPDVSLADDVELDSVPDYTHHEMGAAPTENSDGEPIEVKYSEGIPVSSSDS